MAKSKVKSRRFSAFAAVKKEENTNLTLEEQADVLNESPSTTIEEAENTVLPDINDPEFYCQACYRHYPCKESYHAHLRRGHKMSIGDQVKVTFNPHVKPDVNDPNFYCKSCKKHFSRRENYRTHLQTIHDMTLAPLRIEHQLKMKTLNSEELDQNEPNFYCKACNRRYSSRGNYRHHLRYMHKMTLVPLRRTGRPCKIKNSNDDVDSSENEEIDVHEPNFYCKACKRHFSNRGNYRNHLRYIHKMVLAPLPRRGSHCKIKHINLKPDIDDPNFYCKACEKYYSAKSNYRKHLETIHKMAVITHYGTKRRNNAAINHNIQPDADDPDFYCNACDRKYSSKTAYHVHLQSIHEMTLDLGTKKTYNRHFKSEDSIQHGLNNLELHCIICQKRYATSSSYRMHLRRFHKINMANYRTRSRKPLLSQLNTNQDDVLPDVDDPNFNCKVCNIHYAHKGSYRQHLRNMHHMTLAPSIRTKRTFYIKHSDLQPDVNDPDWYCKACDKRYSTQNYYRFHLRKFHQITRPSRNIKYADLQPNMDDPDFYCKACDKRYSTKGNYRLHIRNTHNMTIPPPVNTKRTFHIKNSNIQPDIDDPDAYCKVCDKCYSDLNYYRVHLRKHHDITLPPRNNRYANLQPDMDDPDFYCKACDKCYSAKSSYRAHLSRIHQMKHGKIERSSNIQPDVDDPDFYCQACERKYSTKYYYRSHLWNVHNMAPVSHYRDNNASRDSRTRVTRQRRLTRSLLL